jgi:hypothetical protein
METLFETRTDADIRREAVADNEQRIHDALMGRGPWPLTERQRKLLEALRGRQGRLLAMPISDLTARLGCDPRSVKADVRELVVAFRRQSAPPRGQAGYRGSESGRGGKAGIGDQGSGVSAGGERMRVTRSGWQVAHARKLASAPPVVPAASAWERIEAAREASHGK